MSDLFLQIGLSNACFSLGLAVVAVVVGATTKRPHLTHLLWVLVFVKLVTPPIVTIPVLTVPVQPDVLIEKNSAQVGPVALMSESEIDALFMADTWFAMLNYAKAWLPPIWLVGSVFVLVWSLVRVRRFNRLLAEQSEIGKEELQVAAAKIARRLELKTVPTIYTTSACLSPMVWWIGGNVRIIIPAAVLDEMGAQKWQWILAHELAHVRRRDYMVRWLEWLACVFFWWNPVVWWAQRHLRAAEEICCDALVMSHLNPNPNSYADSLLKAVEFLAYPAIRPPAMASEINSGGTLERRFKMIVSKTPNRVTSRWLQGLVLLCVVVVLPLGVTYAQESKTDTEIYLEKVAERIQAAVEAGKLTEQDAEAKMAALRREASKKVKFERAVQRIKAAVEAGEITREQAGERLEGLRQRMGIAERRGTERITREEYARVEAELKNAIAEGRVSEKDAQTRLEQMRRIMVRQSRCDKVDWDAIEQRIEAAVEAGEITREQADARYRSIKEEIARREKREEVDWDAIRQRIEAAVEAGEITREEADAKYREIRMRMARRAGQEEVDWDAIKQRIEAAVEAGRISREEADAELDGIEKRMQHRAFVQNIKAAVKEGKMTREEAAEEIRAYELRMRGDEEGILIFKGEQVHE